MLKYFSYLWILAFSWMIPAMGQDFNGINSRSLSELFKGRTLTLTVKEVERGQVRNGITSWVSSAAPDFKVEFSICNKTVEVNSMHLLCISKTSEIIEFLQMGTGKSVDKKMTIDGSDVHLEWSQKILSLDDYIVKIKVHHVIPYYMNETIAETVMSFSEFIKTIYQNDNNASWKVNGALGSSVVVSGSMSDGAEKNPEIWKGRTITDLLTHKFLKVDVENLELEKKADAGGEYFVEAEICTAKLWCTSKQSYPFTVNAQTKKVQLAHGAALFFKLSDFSSLDKLLTLENYSFFYRIKKKTMILFSTEVFSKKVQLDGVVVESRNAKKGSTSYPFTTSDGLKGNFVVATSGTTQGVNPPPIRGQPLPPISTSDADLDKNVATRIKYGNAAQKAFFIQGYTRAIKILKGAIAKTGEVQPDFINSISNKALNLNNAAEAVLKSLTTAQFQMPPADDKDWSTCGGNTLAYVMVGHVTYPGQGTKYSADDIMLCHRAVDREYYQDVSPWARGLTVSPEEFMYNSLATTLIHEGFHQGVARHLNSGTALNECGASFVEYSLSNLMKVQAQRNGYDCPADVEKWVTDPRFGKHR